MIASTASEEYMVIFEGRTDKYESTVRRTGSVRTDKDTKRYIASESFDAMSPTRGTVEKDDTVLIMY